MPFFKPSKTSATVITISLIILSILLIRPEIITKYPYGAIILYKHYKLKKEFEKELDEKWEKQQEEYQKAAEAAEKYVKQIEESKKQREKLLSNDHYGGKTPEETLALFVEALKKKDYKLAAKYYVPWKWEEMENRMELLVSKEDRLNKFINAYTNGIIEKKKRVSFYDIYIYDNKEDRYPYVIEFIFNDKTGIWKIEEF